MFVDPSGLEYLVVSGSEYDDGRWKYNFIETAINKIKQLQDLNDGEWITWIVSSTGYSQEAIDKMNNIAYLNNRNELRLDFEWTRGLSSVAFDNPNTAFYTCNAGTDTNGDFTSFAQYFVNVTGGRSWAARGTTSYYNIMNDYMSNKWTRGNLFASNGSDNLPIACDGVPWMNFY